MAMITKTKVIEYFGTVAKVAEFFGIAPQAVYQWPDEGIPRERELELLLRLPDEFGQHKVKKTVTA